MDPVTHTLCGAVLANALMRRRMGPGAVPILIVSSNLPDLDAIVHLTGDPYALLLRRTFGHSILTLPVWSLLLASVLRRLYQRHSVRLLWAACALGAAGHLVLDLINSFGVELLWPLAGSRPELALVFIIDFFLTGALAAPFVVCAARRLRSSLVHLSRVSLVAVAVYLAVCGASRSLAARVLDAEAAGAAPGPEFSYVFPEPLGPHRWRGALRVNGDYRLYLIQPLLGRADLVEVIANGIGDPLVEAARRSAKGRRLERFFKAPVWEAQRVAGGDNAASPGGVEVTVRDLRFTSIILGRGAIFVFSFRVYPDGRVEG